MATYTRTYLRLTGLLCGVKKDTDQWVLPVCWDWSSKKNNPGSDEHSFPEESDASVRTARSWMPNIIAELQWLLTIPASGQPPTCCGRKYIGHCLAIGRVCSNTLKKLCGVIIQNSPSLYDWQESPATTHNTFVIGIYELPHGATAAGHKTQRETNFARWCLALLCLCRKCIVRCGGWFLSIIKAMAWGILDDDVT